MPTSHPSTGRPGDPGWSAVTGGPSLTAGHRVATNTRDLIADAGGSDRALVRSCPIQAMNVDWHRVDRDP